MSAAKHLWVAAALSAVLLASPARAEQAPIVLAQAADDCAEAKAHFEMARELDVAEAYQAHIDAFGSCPYAAFATILRDKLVSEAGATAPSAGPAPATTTTTPAKPSAGSAGETAQAFADRINGLEALQAAERPRFSFDAARQSAEGVTMSNARFGKPDGSGVTVAEMTLVAPTMQLDGTLRADALILRDGHVIGSEPGGPEEILRFGEGSVSAFELAAPGAGAGPDRLGPLSFGSIRLSGIEGMEEGKSIFTLAGATLDLADLVDGLPTAANFALEALTFTPEQIAEGTESGIEEVRALGYDAFVFNFALDLQRNPATRTLTIGETIAMRDAGEIRFEARVTDLDPGIFDTVSTGNPMAALMALTARLQGASVTFVDDSITGRAIGSAADSQNIDRPLFAAAIPTATREAIEQATGNAALASTVAEGVRAFVNAPQSLSVSLEPGEPVMLAQLAISIMSGMDPMAVLAPLSPSFTVNGSAPVPLVLASLPDATAGLILACDEVAADSDDPSKPDAVEGIAQPEDIDAGQAIPACEAAHEAAPDDARIAFQLGRAYDSAGRAEDAMRLYREAAEAGQAVAMYELALGYFDGRGVAADAQEAVRLMEASSEAGNGFAKYQLAVEKINATTTQADPEGAYRLLTEAAEFGVAEAYTELGKMHFRGQSVPVDYAVALEHFRQAAEEDAASGHFYVGFMTAIGLGGDATDMSEAAAGMMQGLAMGDPDAQAILVDDRGATFEEPVRKAIQEFLREEGYYDGRTNGVIDESTLAAIAAWRADNEG